MTQIKSVTMPDGTTILVRVDSEAVGGDAAFRDHLKLENLGDTVRGVAASVHQSIAGLKADKVSVEFGVELAFESRGLVAVLASGGAKASIKIKLDWDLDSVPAAQQQAPAGEQQTE